MRTIFMLPQRYVSPSGRFRLAQWWRFQVTWFDGIWTLNIYLDDTKRSRGKNTIRIQYPR